MKTGGTVDDSRGRVLTLVRGKERHEPSKRITLQEVEVRQHLLSRERRHTTSWRGHIRVRCKGSRGQLAVSPLRPRTDDTCHDVTSTLVSDRNINPLHSVKLQEFVGQGFREPPYGVRKHGERRWSFLATLPRNSLANPKTEINHGPTWLVRPQGHWDL